VFSPVLCPRTPSTRSPSRHLTPSLIFCKSRDKYRRNRRKRRRKGVTRRHLTSSDTLTPLGITFLPDPQPDFSLLGFGQLGFHNPGTVLLEPAEDDGKVRRRDVRFPLEQPLVDAAASLAHQTQHLLLQLRELARGKFLAQETHERLFLVLHEGDRGIEAVL